MKKRPSTSLERQKLYMARLKAAAEHALVLEEENADLRRRLAYNEEFVKRLISKPGKEKT